MALLLVSLETLLYLFCSIKQLKANSLPPLAARDSQIADVRQLLGATPSL